MENYYSKFNFICPLLDYNEKFQERQCFEVWRCLRSQAYVIKDVFPANPLDKYKLHHRRKNSRYQQQKTSKCQASDLKFK